MRYLSDKRCNRGLKKLQKFRNNPVGERERARKIKVSKRCLKDQKSVNVSFTNQK